MADHNFNIIVTDVQQKCIADSVLDWQEWCERAAQYVIDHKAERCRERMIERDEGLLGDNVPKDHDARAVAIIAHPDHKDRVARDAARG